jgi:hypothetical protein
MLKAERRGRRRVRKSRQNEAAGAADAGAWVTSQFCAFPSPFFVPIKAIEIAQQATGRRVWTYWERCRRGEIMRHTTDLKGAMALGLDVSRTDDVAVVRCRGRIVFGEEADELRRVVLGLLNETQHH